MNRLTAILLSSTFAGAMLGAGVRPAYTNWKSDMKAYEVEALEANPDISNHTAFQMAAQRRTDENINGLWEGAGIGALLGLTLGAAGAAMSRRREETVPGPVAE